MRLLQARKILRRRCRHHEEWHCGRATIHLTGKDSNPRFDRRLEIFMDQPPAAVDLKKISRLLRLLDRLGGGKK